MKLRTTALDEAKDCNSRQSSRLQLSMKPKIAALNETKGCNSRRSQRLQLSTKPKTATLPTHLPTNNTQDYSSPTKLPKTGALPATAYQRPEPSPPANKDTNRMTCKLNKLQPAEMQPPSSLPLIYYIYPSDSLSISFGFSFHSGPISPWSPSSNPHPIRNLSKLSILPSYMAMDSGEYEMQHLN